VRRIGLILPANDLAIDATLRGVIEHRHAGADWRLRRHESALRQRADLDEFLAWRPDGLLCLDRIGEGVVEHLGLPWVRLRAGTGPLVSFDEQRIGAAAAEHLADRGLRRLGVLDTGITGGWETPRSEGFAAACAARGVLAERVLATTSAGIGSAVVAWVRSAPGSCGLFTLNDWYGSLILDHCGDAGLDVPGRLAVVGADDIETWCETAAVPLSSVRVPHRAAARLACGVLDRLLDGEPRPLAPVRLPPLGVTVRASSALAAVDDPVLAAALGCIATRAARGSGVAEVVAAAGVGRRALEQRFRARLGRSILQTIHRARIDHALTLLAEGRLDVPAVARRSGFGDASRFTAACRRHTGATPSALRRLGRGG